MLGFNNMASVLLPETEKNAIARSVLYLFCDVSHSKTFLTHFYLSLLLYIFLILRYLSKFPFN